MSEVRLVTGSGLVGRTASTVWWTADDRLIEALSTLGERGFKGLADAILDLDFEIDGVAAVDLEGGTLFVSGTAFLVSGGVLFDGSTTATWIEQPLGDPAHFAVNAYTSTTNEATDLIAGVVMGGGFVFGHPELEDSPPAPAEQSAEPIQREESVEPDPEEAATFNAAETMIVPSKEPDIETDSAESEDLEPPSEPLSPIIAVVEFDDGRQLEVAVGLIVGRNPTSAELPIGFDSMTVLGEFVSRRHWRLEVRDMVPVLTDLGSASGTIVEFDGEKRKLGPDDSVELGVHSKVLFADHWAVLKVKPA